MDKESIDCGILLRLQKIKKKEDCLAIGNNMAGSGGHNTKWNKADPERQILQALTCRI